MKITLNEAALSSLVNDPSGKIAQELENVAQFIVLRDAQEELGRDSIWDRPGLNPPFGPESGRSDGHNVPRWRTRTLLESVYIDFATVDEKGLVVYVKTHAVNPKTGVLYSEELQERGYRWLPESGFYQFDAFN